MPTPKSSVLLGSPVADHGHAHRHLKPRRSQLERLRAADAQQFAADLEQIKSKGSTGGAVQHRLSVPEQDFGSRSDGFQAVRRGHERNLSSQGARALLKEDVPPLLPPIDQDSPEQDAWQANVLKLAATEVYRPPPPPSNRSSPAGSRAPSKRLGSSSGMRSKSVVGTGGQRLSITTSTSQLTPCRSPRKGAPDVRLEPLEQQLDSLVHAAKVEAKMRNSVSSPALSRHSTPTVSRVGSGLESGGKASGGKVFSDVAQKRMSSKGVQEPGAEKTPEKHPDKQPRVMTSVSVRLHDHEHHGREGSVKNDGGAEGAESAARESLSPTYSRRTLYVVKPVSDKERQKQKLQARRVSIIDICGADAPQHKRLLDDDLGDEAFDSAAHGPRPRSAEQDRGMGGEWAQHPKQGPKKTVACGDLMCIWKVTQDLQLPVDEMRVAGKLFREFADFGGRDPAPLMEGKLDPEAFQKVVCRIANKAKEELPDDLLMEPFRQSNRSGGGRFIGFKDFAEWYHARGFDADLNLTEDDLDFRKLAKKHNMQPTDVERYHYVFRQSDADESGFVDLWEFEQVLYKCAKIPQRIGLPPARIAQLWRMADADGSGEIDFEEFLLFYRKYFDTKNHAVDPFEGYYRDIRRVSVASFGPRDEQPQPVYKKK